MVDEKEEVPNIEWADVPSTGPGVSIDGERVPAGSAAQSVPEPKFGTVKNVTWGFLDDQRLRLRLTTTEAGVIEVAIRNDHAMTMLVALNMIRQRKNIPLPKMSGASTAQRTSIGLNDH
jgi:hypothetical protein